LILDRHPSLSKDFLLGKGMLDSGASGSVANWFANAKEQGADKASTSQLGTGTAAADASCHQMDMTYD
jgi:hypothetical protein